MRAQGSLEYLVIVLTAVAVLAIAASFITSYFSTQSGQFYYASCSSAAALCRDTLLIDSNNGCSICNNACNYTNGTEIFTNATTCCRMGKPSEIYGGSIGTNCVSAPPTPGPVCLELDGTTVVPEGLCASTKIGKRCVSGSLQPACNNGCECPENLKCDTGNNYCYGLSFAEANISDVFFDVRALAVGDANKDGRNEIVIGMRFGPAIVNEIRMYDNKDGGWTETNISDPPAEVMAIAIGDVNNDTYPDIVAGLTATTGELRIYENKTGGWTGQVIKDLPLDLEVSSLAIGDADNDGYNEIVVFISSASGVALNKTRMYKNYSGAWIETNISDPPSNTGFIAVGDANNDTKNDIVVGFATFSTPPGQVWMHENRSGGWINSVVSTEPQGVYSVAIGDANNDNTNEVAVGIFPLVSIANEIRIYQYGLSGWTKTEVHDIPNPTIGLKVADVDSDGKNEVIIGMYSVYNETRIYDNRSGKWVETNITNLAAPLQSMDFKDADNDGYNELIVGMRNTQRPYPPYNSECLPPYVDPNSPQFCTINEIRIYDISRVYSY